MHMLVRIVGKSADTNQPVTIEFAGNFKDRPLEATVVPVTNNNGSVFRRVETALVAIGFASNNPQVAALTDVHIEPINKSVRDYAFTFDNIVATEYFEQIAAAAIKPLKK